MKFANTKLNLACALLFFISHAQANCHCEQITKMVNGSRVCSCRPGYIVSPSNPAKCLDINECSSTTVPVCDQICTNTNGSYVCSCRDGYNLNPRDSTKCDDINECSSTSATLCDQICTNTNGSYECSCTDGYNINLVDPTKCDDINECTDTTNPVCEQTCTNTPGSFLCSCGNGYNISTDDPTKCVGCGPNWMLRPGTSFCYKFVQSSMPWFDAQSACGSLGGALASITSQDEQDFLADQMKNQTSDMWIGYSDRVTEATWIMENENCVNYTNWGAGEPIMRSISSGFSCAVIQLYTTYNSFWLNKDCESKSYPFICKKNIADEIPIRTENSVCSLACSNTSGCSNYFYANDKCILYVYKKEVPQKLSLHGFTSSYLECQSIN